MYSTPLGQGINDYMMYYGCLNIDVLHLIDHLMSDIGNIAADIYLWERTELFRLNLIKIGELNRKSFNDKTHARY